jgi:hypothetical protein
MQIQVSLSLEINANATFSEMEAQIQEAGHRWMREALAKTVRAWEGTRPFCRRCGGAVRTEGTTRRTILTLFGQVQVIRRRFRCQSCHHRFCPSTELLQELHLSQVSQGLREAAILAGASWPYRHAAATLQRLSGAQISAEEIRLLTNEQGKLAARRQREQAEAAVPSAPAASEASIPTGELCVIGQDGGWVCNREKRGGMEGKVAVIASGQEKGKEPEFPSEEMTWYELGKYMRTHRHPPRQRSRWNTRRYVATFEPASTLGKLAAHAIQEMGLHTHPQVVVADGAHWIKKETATHFPQAERILDWPHLWRTIRKAADAVELLMETSAQAHGKQVEQVKQWLWHGQVEPASELLKAWRNALSGEGRKIPPALRAAITYLEKQRDWIGSYEQWKQQGYPVGSGIVERAVSLVINRRMKRRGMRWLRKNATAVVALRVDLLNHDWQRPLSARLFP